MLRYTVRVLQGHGYHYAFQRGSLVDGNMFPALPATAGVLAMDNTTERFHESVTALV